MPIQNAMIISVPVRTFARMRKALTAEDGTFAITGLAPGTYILLIHARGYKGEFYDDVRSWKEAKTIQVVAGQEVAGIEIGLCPQPVGAYLVAGRVDGLAPGVFSYRPDGHELLKVFEGDRRAELASAALGQSWVKDAPASIVISAVYERTTGKYRERGIRYVHMEAGHAAQNVCLQAVALELGSVVVGAFVDGDVKKVLHMPDSEDPLAIIPVGRMR
ncbi:MAG: SagB/ThcOx family dehydrogenase [Syntrophobacteraceae bacterium]|nr:SagB/ThcOx family dehydrogenase [Syntrophobacteraceae bacterium]